MRLPSLLFAFFSVTFGALQACSSTSESPGNEGNGGSPSSSGGSGGNGAAAGTTPLAGAPAGGSGGSGVSGGTGIAGGGASGGRAGASGGPSLAGRAGAAGSVSAGAGGAAAGTGGVPSAGSGGTTAGTTGTAGASGGSGGGAHALMNFFVTSDTSKTANLGGLSKADERCQTLAQAVGHGEKTWRAYLSVESPPTHARDRIGPGPYYNSKGEQLAADKTALHARDGNAQLFLDEKGNPIDGQWNSAGNDNQHDILTGSKNDGSLEVGKTCGDWTATTGSSQVGHSDGLGPNMNSGEPYRFWAGAHTGQCGNTQPGGGAGRIYCFVGP